MKVIRTVLRRTAPRLPQCLSETHPPPPACQRAPESGRSVSVCSTGVLPADAWASSSCGRTMPSKVCACSIDICDNNISLLHLDSETTMWITTSSEPDSCQLNQRYTTCYMDPPHNCNEQLPTMYQPRTDVTGLSDMWGTKKRKM